MSTDTNLDTDPAAYLDTDLAITAVSTVLERDDHGDLTGTPADTLRVAATYLADYGWWQGDLYADLTISCPPADVPGAVRAVVYGYANDAPVLDGRLGWHVDIALGVLADHLDHLNTGQPDDGLTLLGWLDYAGHAVTAWNDDTGRTLDQVLTAMRAAADRYDTTPARGGGL